MESPGEEENNVGMAQMMAKMQKLWSGDVEVEDLDMGDLFSATPAKKSVKEARASASYCAMGLSPAVVRSFPHTSARLVASAASWLRPPLHRRTWKNADC